MQYNKKGSDEEELIRLLLKRQSELNSLLEVTRAINKNTSISVLMQMLESILKSYLQVGKLRFLVEKDGSFIYLSKYGGQFEPVSVINLAYQQQLKKVNTPIAISGFDNEVLKNYDYYIPIYYKSKVHAYTLIGDFPAKGEMLNNDLNFIQTLINLIVVALENKKLFRQRMETERFQREMELAGEVQNMLIPVKIHKDKAVEIGAKYLPHQNIGGDYFDFIRLNKNEFIWCIADVSGKGISAALLMANFQASLRAWATVEEDLTTVMERLNKIVLQNTKGEKFITLFLAKYNEKTRRLNYINAGHNPSILYARGEAIPLKLGTTMIGVFDELPFLNEGEIDIDPGSLIFNYTDGLMDYEVEQAHRWNEDRLIEFVIKHGRLSPDKFNETLMEYLTQVVKGKPIDDITLFTLHIF